MEGLHFSIVDELDNEIDCEILMAYKLLKTHKNYMIYTDNSRNEDGSLNAYAAIYDPNDESVFEELQTDYEKEEAQKRILELEKYSGMVF
ncbi:MAG: hypothetical protein IKR57_06570 [Bacilli bacterium]|nr:hypothetical protein [Bacilli bacterium]